MKWLKPFESYILEKYISTGPQHNSSDVIDLRTMDLFWKNVEASTKPNYKKTNEFKELSTFLKSRIGSYNESLIKLYHGTSANNNVMDVGLLTTKAKSKKSYQSEIGYVYLSVYPESAETFGSLAYPHDDIIVYEVIVPLGQLKADKDQLNNIRRESGENITDTLVESLVIGNGARIKGDIPIYMINEFKRKEKRK